MNNRLIIKELSCLEEISASTVMGSGDVIAIARTVATTVPGSANAGAVTFAAGQMNATKTQTHAKIGSGFSLADANASAFARSGKNIALLHRLESWLLDLRV